MSNRIAWPAREAFVRSIFFVTVIVGAMVLGGALVPGLLAQQSSNPQAELLAEVRLLRQAIESLTGVNARVQIVFGRLQLQEQRTAAAGQRLDQARDAAAKITQEIARHTENLHGLEAIISDGRRKPDELEQAKAESAMIARLLERLEQDRVRLIASETEAVGALNQEQGRWSDLNRQLEELERALAKR
jgi:hypothetical protein